MGYSVFPQSSSISEALQSDCLVSYPGYSLRESYSSAEMQSGYSIAQGDWAKTVSRNISNFFKQIYLTHRWDPNKYYNSGLECNLGVMAMKGYLILLRVPEPDAVYDWLADRLILPAHQHAKCFFFYAERFRELHSLYVHIYIFCCYFIRMFFFLFIPPEVFFHIEYEQFQTDLFEPPH